MRIKIFMAKFIILSSFIFITTCLISSSHLFANQNLINKSITSYNINYAAQSNQDSNTNVQQTKQPQKKKSSWPFYIVIIGLIIAIYGIRKAYKGEICIIANQTDFVFTASTALIIALYLLGDIRLFSTILVLLPIAGFVCITIATYRYNDNIIDFLLALYVKIVLMALMLFLAAGGIRGEKQKGETQRQYIRRTNQEIARHHEFMQNFRANFIFKNMKDQKYISIMSYLRGL
jgi:uncharacterized membrane protein